MNTQRFVSLLGLNAIALPSAFSAEFDWPQWQGPDRNAISKETGLLQQWPEGGPPLAWKITDLGGGYSAPAVANGKIFGISKRDAEEFVWARSEQDGSPIWEQKIGTTEEGGMRQGIEGAGCTPTVDGERLYVIGHGGDLLCLQSSDGAILWRKHFIRDFGGRLPTWRFNESPLIDGDHLICTPGGVETTMIALNKMSGEVVWKSTIPDSANATEPASPRPASAPTPAPSPAPAPDPNQEGGRAPSQEPATPSPAAGFEPVVVVAAGSKWKYLDTGKNPGASWTTAEFDDAAWTEGEAQLGYGDSDEKTVLNAASENYPTYYFRRKFEVADPAQLKPLIIRLLRDDGAIVYLNGKQVVRDNMPEGEVNRDSFASSTTQVESGFHVYDLATTDLVAGENVLAVQVHQADSESTDVSFDLELREKVPGRDIVGAPRPDRRRGGRDFGGGRSGGGRFGESGAAYASAIAIEVNGQRQYVQLTSKTLAGISADDGKLLWRYDRPANRAGINCSTPIYMDGHIFAASAYGNGGGLAKLTAEGDGAFKAEEVWFSRDMENHHGGMVVIDGCLYGANGGNGGGYLVCLDFETGETLWNEDDRDKRRAAKGSIAFADGRIYYRTEEGTVLLIEPNRDGYIERGRFDQSDRTRQPAWTHPVIANGKLYIRDQDSLYCYNVKITGG